MNLKNTLRPISGLIALLTLATAAQAQDPPPPTTHGNDVLWGRSGGYGTPDFGSTGSGTGLWFSDSGTNPTRLAAFLAAPIGMIPNINAPDSDPATPNSPGSVYYNFGTNEVYSNGGATGTLRTGVMQLVSISPGLEIWKSQYRFFAPAGTPTSINNTFPYPYVGTWHNHFAVRAFRPGTYTFQYKLTNVVAYDYTSLTDSPVYTMTFRSRPVLSGKVDLQGGGWAKTDTSRNLTGNRARVFLFAPDSTPAHESDALDYTDVYLDNSGNFSVPEGLNITEGKPYRVGVKPLTMYGLAVLLPGNFVLSVASPANVGLVALNLGDTNGDGSVDATDFGTFVSAYNSAASIPGSGYDATADFNGDGFVDPTDFGLFVGDYNTVADFLP